MKSSLRFIDYIVDEVSFKNNYGQSDEFEIDFDIKTSVNYKDDNKFILKLNLNLFDNKVNKEDAPFFMSVCVIGIFETDKDIDDQLKEDLAEINSVAILFPYVRALVSNYTALANVSPLILPPINVIKYMEEKKKESSF